jgi:hypothetical protein
VFLYCNYGIESTVTYFVVHDLILVICAFSRYIRVVDAFFVFYEILAICE